VRAPLNYETSVPGIFAVGDVRLDSMKRAASAVGAGVGAIQNVHQYLEQLGEARGEASVVAAAR
jgi:thioredoxin reductase (NADPH)